MTMSYTQVWDPILNAVNPNLILTTDSEYPDRVAWVPNDEGNKDWRAYQDWLAEGNQPTPYTPPPASEAQSG